MKTVLRKKGVKSMVTIDSSGMKSIDYVDNSVDYYVDNGVNKTRMFDNQEIEILKLYKRKIRRASNIKKEVIQETVIKMLEYAKTKKIDKIENLFNRIERNTNVNKWAKNNNNGVFEEFTDTYTVGQTYSKDYKDYQDTIDYIKSKLSEYEFELFDMYHVNKLTQDSISNEIGKSRQTVGRDIIKLNNKLHRLRIKELYRLDLVAPCLTQDKKHGKYRPTLPNTKVKKYKSKVLGKTIVNHAEVATIKREYGPWRGQIAYVYSCPVSQRKQYEGKKIEYKASEKVNNIENLPCNFIGTEYFTPTLDKPLCDDLSYIAVSTNSCLEYKALKKSYDYKGNLNNVYGACYNHNTIDIKAHGRASGLIDRVKIMHENNQLKIDTMIKHNLI